VKQLHLGGEIEQKCEWSCLLWCKDHWAAEARKAQILFQESKDRVTTPTETRNTFFSDSHFANTIAQVYVKLFGTELSCSVKNFSRCPFMGQRQDLLERGTLAGVFATILHKAVSYAMLDKHPLDSGLIHEEYGDVYGIDLTNFVDLENSLTDGRFAILYGYVLKKAKELAGIARA
jgi:hypothetical protein